MTTLTEHADSTDVKLRHKIPCNECPFRRKAPAGWLGGLPLSWFLERIRFQGRIACHKTIGPGKKLAQCAGQAIHLKNSMSTPRDAAFAADVHAVSESPDVFQWLHEFEKHHLDVAGWVKQAKEKAAALAGTKRKAK